LVVSDFDESLSELDLEESLVESDFGESLLLFLPEDIEFADELLEVFLLFS
jgi:hypothetical protein